MNKHVSLTVVCFKRIFLDSSGRSSRIGVRKLIGVQLQKLLALVVALVVLRMHLCDSGQEVTKIPKVRDESGL